MDTNNPLFGYALIPANDTGYFLFIPLSDSLKTIVNGLHNAIILLSSKSQTLDELEAEYGDCIALNANNDRTEHLFVLTENPFEEVVRCMYNRKGGALLARITNRHEAIMNACNKEGNCKVQYHKDGKLAFCFTDETDKIRQTFPLTLKEFQSLMNKAYTLYINQEN